MSIPAIGPFLPAAAIRSPERRLAYRRVTPICIMGGLLSVSTVIASVVLLQLTLLAVGLTILGLTALTGIGLHHHNFKILSSRVHYSMNEFEKEFANLVNAIEEIRERTLDEPENKAIMGRLAVLEKEFLNRGRYKYIDETPGPDDVPVPSSAANSPSSSSESSPKSSRLSSDLLPK